MLKMYSLTTPVDDTYAANAIHTQIQNDKIAIRERMECPNALFKEHTASDDDDAGLHVSSEVGFARASTWANRLTAGLKVGSLHWATDLSTMHLINSSEEYECVEIISHNDERMAGLTDDDHTQYLLKDGTRDMSGDLIIGDGGAVIPTAYPAAAACALDPDHVNESWYTAHGADKLVARIVADRAIRMSAIAMTSVAVNESKANDFVISAFYGYVLTGGGVAIGDHYLMYGKVTGGLECSDHPIYWGTIQLDA